MNKQTENKLETEKNIIVLVHTQESFNDSTREEERSPVPLQGDALRERGQFTKSEIVSFRN